LIKLFFLFLALSITGYIASFLSNNPGEIIIEWYGWLIKSSVSVIILITLISIIFIFYLIKAIVNLFKIPKRIKNNFPRYKFDINKSLNFEKPCLKTFNNLKLAFNAAQNGGNAPCVLNASNEIVVESFLKEKIKFLDMTNIIEESLNKISYIANPNLEELIETDYITRNFTKKIINNL